MERTAVRLAGAGKCENTKLTLSDLSGASFSSDRIYRRQLWRRWDLSLPWFCLLGLNSSKAGETESDPTVTRQIERAKRLGCGSLVVANAFDLVSTDPRGLKTHPKPLSEDNDSAILGSCALANESGGIILAAWGSHAVLHDRHQQMLKLLKDAPLMALGVNANRTPVHPLYLPYSARLMKYPR